MNMFSMFNDDPFFSGQMESMRRMESMMDSMMGPYFGNQRAAIEQHGPRSAFHHQNMLMPFGFGGGLFSGVDNMFANFSQMSNDPNCHSFSSSSVMTYSTDGSGQPQVYQASSSTRTAPGGVKETRETVQDSRTGLQRMAIGHHLNDRGHVIEKKKNRYTGDEEDNEEFINLEDDDADRFNQEWQQRAHAFNRSPMHHPSLMGSYEQPRSHSPQMLAITDGATATPDKKKSHKHKRRHGGNASGGPSHRSSSSNRPAPYQ